MSKGGKYTHACTLWRPLLDKYSAGESSVCLCDDYNVSRQLYLKFNHYQKNCSDLLNQHKSYLNKKKTFVLFY